MATKEDLLVLISAQAPSLTDEQKAEVVEVAYTLSITQPGGTNAATVARALALVTFPAPAAPPPAPLNFDQEVGVLLDGASLTAEERSTALMIVGKVRAKNPTAPAETCVRIALRKVLR